MVASVDVNQGWQFVSIGYEGQPGDIAGVNPWESEWTTTRYQRVFDSFRCDRDQPDRGWR
jgi:hypothetical protein